MKSGPRNCTDPDQILTWFGRTRPIGKPRTQPTCTLHAQPTLRPLFDLHQHSTTKPSSALVTPAPSCRIMEKRWLKDRNRLLAVLTGVTAGPVSDRSSTVVTSITAGPGIDAWSAVTGVMVGGSRVSDRLSIVLPSVLRRAGYLLVKKHCSWNLYCCY